MTDRRAAAVFAWLVGASALSCGQNDGGSGPELGATGGSATGGSSTGGAATGGSAGATATGGSTSSGGSGGSAPTGGSAGATASGGASQGGDGTGGETAAGGSAGNAGTDALGGTAGSDAGAAGTSGAAGTAGMAAIDCSEATLRTGPPAGKEMFRTDPIDEVFPFASHWMGVFSDDAADEANSFISMTSLSDLDHDGDLDFATGQRHDVGGGMLWWEYCSPDHWVRHEVGTGHTSAAGGNSMDVDGDGWVDLLAGDSWYRNPQTPRSSAWERFEIGSPGAEEVIVGEVTGADPPEALYVWRSIQPQFWTPGADPTEPWDDVELTDDMDKRQQQGGAIADIDGDGRNDIVVGYQWWYHNDEPDGRTWTAMPLVDSGFDNEPLTHVGDIDGDDDVDVVMCTHFGTQPGDARVAWAENADGEGGSWTLHPIGTDKSFTHAIVAADFDNDGDLDVFVGQNVGEQWIFENDGSGAFVEHRILMDSRGHEARVGDVDCDGDLDITGKPWGQQNEGGEQDRPPRDHVYLRNMLVEDGGPALFERGPYEILPAAQVACP